MDNYILKDGVLYHHGIKGQKWGDRRWQYEDGSLTPEGRRHYGYGEARANYKDAKIKYKLAKKEYSKSYDKYLGPAQLGGLARMVTKKGREKDRKLADDLNKKAKLAEDARLNLKKAKQEYKNSEEYKQAKDKMKKVAIAGAVVAGAALATYGVYKYSQIKKEKNLAAAEKEGKRRAAELMRSFESAKESINKGSISGRNEHYKWTTGKDGSYSIRALTDSEKYADNVRAANEYNARMQAAIDRDRKNGINITSFRKAVPYDPRKKK